MSSRQSKKIASYSALSGSTLALSLFLPRMFQGSGGFADATSAALIFMALFIVSVFLAIFVFSFTIKHFHSISMQYRLLGLIPVTMVLLSAVVFYFKFIG